jgi:hypothetical protein
MAEIIVDQTDLNITITPNTTQLNVFAGGYACAQGNTTEFQYNNGGVLAGANGLTYNSGSQTTTAANLTVTNDTNLGAVGNVTITGGNVNQFLQTDGAGGLSFADVANANYANFAGTVLTNAQPNITSVGTLSNLTVSGNVTANYFLGNGSQLTGLAPGDSISNGTSNVRVLSANGAVAIGVNGNANILVANSTGITVNRANLGSVANLNITGGNNGFVLQTDGTGNLTWTAMTGNAGNGTVGGSNTQVQYNDGGAFAGSAGFTFNKASNLLSAPGGITAVGNVQGAYLKGDGSLISNIPGGTSVANGNSSIAITASSGNAVVTINNTATTTFTNSAINVSVAINSTVANGTAPLTVNSQTKVANLNADLLDGYNTATANTANTIALRDTSGNVSANYFIGNGAFLTGIDTAGISNGNSNVKVFSNSNVAISVAGNANVLVTTGTGVNVAGTLNATGNANVGNLGATNIVGTIATASQPSITSLGTLTGLGVNGNITAANITANTGIFSGNGSGLTNLTGANVTGTVANATYAISAGSANTAGTVTNAAQPNITSVGTLSSLAVTANITAGNVYANSGTVRGSLLTGTLTTNAQPNITSVGTLSTLSTTGNANIGNNLTVTGNLTVLGNFIADSLSNGSSNVSIAVANGNVTTSVGGTSNVLVVTSTGANIAGTLRATGNANVGNISATTAIVTTGNITNVNSTTANLTTINSQLLQSSSSGNVKINLSDFFKSLDINCNNATFSQIYITELLTTIRTNATIQGNANVTNLNATAGVVASTLTSNVATGTAPLTVASTTRVANLNVAQANVSDFITVAAGTGNNFLIFANAATGNVAEVTSTGIFANLSNNSITATTFIGDLSGNATSATSATTAGTVTTNAQPNITSVGTLTSLSVTGNISGGNANLGNSVVANYFTGNFYGTANAATTAGTVTTGAQPNITSFGNLTTLVLANGNVILGSGANSGTSPTGVIALGQEAKGFGSTAGNSFTIAIGYRAGYVGQATRGIAIGQYAGSGNAGGIANTANYQGQNAIAIGHYTGYNSQSEDAIAIGRFAGANAQGTYSVAIGVGAGANAQANNSIVLNATGANLNANTANALFIKPVRTVNSTAGLNQLYYDSTTGEIVVYVP